MISAQLPGEASAAPPPTQASPQCSSSPSRSPSTQRSKRSRSQSDEEAVLPSCGHGGESGPELQAAIEGSLAPDMKRRMRVSLQETLVDLKDEYPAEMEAADSQTALARAQRRAAGDLSNCASGKPTPLRTPLRSPLIPALSTPEHNFALPPALSLDENPSGPTLQLDDFVCHDGLLDHEQLTAAIYESQGLSLATSQSVAREFLETIGLRPHDLGVKNTDENGRVLVNQCFYLSIAHAYLGQATPDDQVSSLALRLKYFVEASVLKKRPGWAASTGGELEAMAFADFLPIAMHDDEGGEETPNLVAELAVCILDSVQGHVEVYIGPKYSSLDAETREKNLLHLWFTPGHYQCIVCDDGPGSKILMDYEHFKELLVKQGVMFIETTEM